MRLSEVQRYTRTLARLSDASRTSVESVIAAWMSEHPDATVVECREFAKSVIAAAVERYGDAASVNAARLYDETMAAEGVMVEPAEIYDGPNTERIDRTVRMQAAKLAGEVPDQAGFAAQVAVLARDMVHWAANETVECNVARDSKTRNGGSVRFARIPTRPNPCPWCAMLASRGFVYMSADTAEAASHRHCACIVMPGVEGVTEVEGYDPDHWYDYWQNPEKYGEGGADIVFPNSVGADVRRDEVRIPRKVTGLDHDLYTQIARGSRITGTKKIAGAGTNVPIHSELESLKEEYPEVDAREWEKWAGNGVVEDLGLERRAHLHWYWSEAVGRVRMKVDHFLR